MKTLHTHRETQNGQHRRDPVEKRACIRYPFSPTVEGLDISANIRIVGRLSEISRNGCYIETINPFPPKTSVTLTITYGSQSFKTDAKVVYSQTGMGMGLSFTHAEPEQLRLLGMWLNELSTGKPVEQLEPEIEMYSEALKSVAPDIRNTFEELVVLLEKKGFLHDSESRKLLRKLSK